MANKKTSNKNKKKLQKQYAKSSPGPSSSGEYVVGTLGDMIVKSSCGVGEPEFDPKLASLFSKPITSRVIPGVNVKNKTKKMEEAMPAPPIRQKFNVGTSNPRPRQNGDGELKNKDAASIRVGVKAKFNNNSNSGTVSQEGSDPIPSAKLKRLQSSKKRTQDGKKLRHRPREGAMTVTAPDQRSQPASTQDVPNVKKEKSKGKAKQVSFSQEEDEEDEDVDLPNSEEPPPTKEESDDKTFKKKDKSESVGEIKKSLKELNAPKEKNPELEARTLFVGNVPKEAKKKQILQILKPFGGSIETIRFRCAAPDKPTTLKKVASNRKELHPDRASIAAYIRFSSRDEAEQVMDKAKAEGLTLGDHHLVLDLADNSLKRDNKNAIFVGNVPLKTQDDEVWELFSGCGQIESVRIIRDRDSGLGKGFGYVNFVDRASVELALKMDGTDFNKRELRISRCVKKLKKTDNNGPGSRTTFTGSKFNGQKRGGPAGKPFRTAGEGVRHNQNNNTAKQSAERGAKPKRTAKKISQGQRQRKDGEQFSGDRTAEVGKFKRNSKKPNREDAKKVRMAKQLTSTCSSSTVAIPTKDYKTKKKEMRKMNKPRWPRNK